MIKKIAGDQTVSLCRFLICRNDSIDSVLQTWPNWQVRQVRALNTKYPAERRNKSELHCRMSVCDVIQYVIITIRLYLHRTNEHESIGFRLMRCNSLSCFFTPLEH